MSCEPLRTHEERLKYIDRGWAASDRLGAGFSRETPFGFFYFFDVPLDRLTDFQHAVDEERASLALPPRRLDGRRQPRWFASTTAPPGQVGTPSCPSRPLGMGDFANCRGLVNLWRNSSGPVASASPVFLAPNSFTW